MGNVLSRCANEVTNVFRNCRSKKSEDERKHTRNLDEAHPDGCGRHQQRHHKAETGLLETDQAAVPEHREPLAHSASQVEDDCLPECDQIHAAHCSQSGTALRMVDCNISFEQEPRISKEFIIQTYKISKPAVHTSTCTSNVNVESADVIQPKKADGTFAKSCAFEPKNPDHVTDSCSVEPWIMGDAGSESCRPVLQPKKSDIMALKQPEQVGKSQKAGDATVQSEFSATSPLKPQKERSTLHSCAQTNVTEFQMKRLPVQPEFPIQPRTIPGSKVHERERSKVNRSKECSTQTDRIQSLDVKVETAACIAIRTDKQTSSQVNAQSSTEKKSKALTKPGGEKCEPVKRDNIGGKANMEEDKEEQVLAGHSSDWSCGVNPSHTVAGQSGGEEQVPERVRKLEQRQETVLKELQKLQQNVQSLAQQRGVNLVPAGALSSAGVATASTRPSPLQNGKLHELVISADPSSVPLSLLVLIRQLSTQCQVLTSTFVHSSATDTPQKLRSFLQNGPEQGARSNYQLAVTVVWKKVTNGPRMMVSPTRQTYIQGEANIARYLSRLMQPAYDSNDIITATQIDEVLDLSQQQLFGGNNKERSAALRTLNARLGKGQWLVGSSLTVADVVAWSAVQGTKLAADAPTNVKKWLKSCADNEVFQDAVRFLSS